MADPHITLALLNYNTTDELLRALAALPAALGEIPARIVVIDNASHDNPAARIRAACPAAEVILNPVNLGFAAAFNRLFSYAITPYYLLLNSDIVLPAGGVAAMLETARAFPTLGLAGVALVREDGSAQTSYGRIPTLASELLNRSLWRRLTQRTAPTEPFDVESVIGAVMLVPRRTIERVGGMDERYFFYMEETDWCKRIRDAGLRVMHFPGIAVLHLQGRAAGKRHQRARIEFHRSRMLFFLTHYGRGACAILYAGTLLRMLINTLAHLVLVAITLGLVPSLRRKLATYAGVLTWYLLGCPQGWGLR
jgi:hypothetical protein